MCSYAYDLQQNRRRHERIKYKKYEMFGLLAYIDRKGGEWRRFLVCL